MKTFQPKSPLLDHLGRQPRPGEPVHTLGGAWGNYVGTTEKGIDYVVYDISQYEALRATFVTRVAPEAERLHQMLAEAERVAQTDLLDPAAPRRPDVSDALDLINAIRARLAIIED